VKASIERPLAITMWDFSWLERRWPGAGYEDWDRALSELRERGYDAVRIDAYPHLVAADAEKTWELLPEWSVQDWGAPARTRVQVWPALPEFIARCREHGIRVGLSTWFREDVDKHRMLIRSPQDHARIWLAVLDRLQAEGLHDALLYVDLCNEFPIPPWAPFLHEPGKPEFRRATPEGEAWMHDSIATLREKYPQLDYTYSFCSEYDTWERQDVSMLDFLEPHVWMAQSSDFYEKVGYHYARFDRTDYDNLALNGERVYREREEHWNDALKRNIERMARWSRASGKALVTTECWGVVDYKDFPLLDWGYVKELCEIGVTHAARQGRWVGIATSNFCGPQFHGMWRDVAWHRRLTDLIHDSPIDDELLTTDRRDNE
jgi:hypothetical protein